MLLAKLANSLCRNSQTQVQIIYYIINVPQCNGCEERKAAETVFNILIHDNV